MSEFMGYTRFRSLVALGVLAVCALLGFVWEAQATQVYWGTDGDSIERANLDGSGHEVVLSGLSWPIGVVLDGQGEKMYWTDAGQNTIHRSNLDGSGVEDVSLVASINFPAGIALDSQAGKMYWAELDGKKIQRANLDGSNSEVLVTMYDGSSHEFIAIELDVASGKMYWAEDSGNLGRANLDGTDPETIVTGLRSPNDIALDLRAGKIYWTDDGSTTIARANLDGSGIEDLSSVEMVGGQPWGIAVDALAGKMYWGNQGLDRIQRANLNGTQVEDLVTDVHRAFGVTLDLSGRDWDSDGLTDGEEDALGTDPMKPDTDEDGYSDIEEVEAETDPLDENDPPPCTFGDLNCSGNVDAVDIQLVVNEALSISTGHNCDLNKSGTVDAIDVQLTINAALGLVEGRRTNLVPYITLDDTAYSICEIGESDSFIIGTGGIDSIRTLETDEDVQTILDFGSDPGPWSSCWWNSRFYMGFLNHGDVLVGQANGDGLSYIQTGARQILAMTPADDETLILCAMFKDDQPLYTEALIKLQENGEVKTFTIFAEALPDNRSKPHGIAADGQGAYLVSASDGNDAGQGYIYRVEQDGSFSKAYTHLTLPKSMVRWDNDTVLVTEFYFSRFPAGGRILALRGDGTSICIAEGFLGIGQMCLASDRSLLIPEHGAGMESSKSIYRLTEAQILSALSGQRVYVPQRP